MLTAFDRAFNPTTIDFLCNFKKLFQVKPVEYIIFDGVFLVITFIQWYIFDQIFKLLELQDRRSKTITLLFLNFNIK